MEASEKKIESDISFPDIALFAAATIKVRNFQSSMDSLSASLDSFDTEGLDFGVDGSDVVQVKSNITTLCDTTDSPVNETYEALVKTSELLMAGMDLSSVDSLFDGTEILSFIGNDVEGCLETADKCNELAAEYYSIMQKKQKELDDLWKNYTGEKIGDGTLQEFIDYIIAGNTPAQTDEQEIQNILEMNNDVIGITAAMAIFKQLANINEQKAFDLITELPDYDANSDARIASSTTEINQRVLVDGNWLEIHTLDEYIEWLDTRVPPPEDWERAQMIQVVLTDSENNDALNIIYYDKDGNIIENPSALDLARYIRGNDINIDNLFLNSDENNEIVEYITRFLPYLDEQQLKTLSYLSNTNSEYYDKYYKMCQATVNQKIGHEDFETLKALLEANDDASYWPELLGDCVWLMGAGLADGLENFFDGFGNVFSADGVLSSDQYKTMELMKYLADEHKDDKFKETVKAGSYEIMSSVANMYIPYLVACIPGCQPIALAMFGASIYGNARDRGLSLGMNEGKATLYALTDAGLELGLMYVLGGIAKFGGEKSLAKLAANKAPQLAWLFRGLGETTEESLQAIIDQLMTEGKVDAAGGKEALKDGAYGFIISLIFGGFAGEPVSLDTKIEEMGSTTRTTSPDGKTVTLVNEEIGIKKTIELDSNGNTRIETIEYTDGTSKVNEFKDGTQTTTEYDSNGVMLKETIINKDSTIKITEFNPKNGHTITYEVDGNGTITEIETDEDGIELRRSRRYGVNSPERSATQTEDSSTETSPADSTDTSSSATTDGTAENDAGRSIKIYTDPKTGSKVVEDPASGIKKTIEFDPKTGIKTKETIEYTDGTSKVIEYGENGLTETTYNSEKEIIKVTHSNINDSTQTTEQSGTNSEEGTGVNPEEATGANPEKGTGANPEKGTSANPETSPADSTDTSSATTEAEASPAAEGSIKTETSPADSTDTSSATTETEASPAAEGSIKAETSPEKEAFAKATDFVPPRSMDAWSRDSEFTETATNLDEIKEYVDNHQGKSKEYILLCDDIFINGNTDNVKSISSGNSLVTLDEYKQMAESSNFYIKNATVHDNGLIEVKYEMIRYNSYPLVEPNPVVNPEEVAVAPVTETSPVVEGSVKAETTPAESKPVAVPDNGTGTPAVNPETSIADTADASPSAATESNPAAIKPDESAVAPGSKPVAVPDNGTGTPAVNPETSTAEVAEADKVDSTSHIGDVATEIVNQEKMGSTTRTTYGDGRVVIENEAAGIRKTIDPNSGTVTREKYGPGTTEVTTFENGVEVDKYNVDAETGKIIEPNSETSSTTEATETNPVVNPEEVAVAPVTDTATETTSHINPVTETTTESTTQTSTYIHPVTNDRPHLEQPIPSVEQPKQPAEQPKPPVEQPKPPVEQPKTEPGDTTTQTVVPPNTGGEGQTKRILVADCSPHYDLITVMNTLVRQNKMVAVTSQEDCLYKLQSNIKFNALFMDESLLEKNGKEFFAQVKGIIPFGVPIILVGNKKYLELGFDGHVSKPINIPNLAQYLSNFI